MKNSNKKGPKGKLYPWEVFYTKPRDPMKAVMNRYIKASNEAIRVQDRNAFAALLLIAGASLGATFGPKECIFLALIGVVVGLLPWKEK